jgi:hypothetical protein
LNEPILWAADAAVGNRGHAHSGYQQRLLGATRSRGSQNPSGPLTRTCPGPHRPEGTPGHHFRLFNTSGTTHDPPPSGSCQPRLTSKPGLDNRPRPLSGAPQGT